MSLHPDLTANQQSGITLFLFSKDWDRKTCLSGQVGPVKISFTESIVILDCSSIALDPISDKRLYTLYRTVALLYIKLYNSQPANQLTNQSIPTWSFGSSIEQSTKSEDDSSFIFLNYLKGCFNYTFVLLFIRRDHCHTQTANMGVYSNKK